MHFAATMLHMWGQKVEKDHLNLEGWQNCVEIHFLIIILEGIL